MNRKTDYCYNGWDIMGRGYKRYYTIPKDAIELKPNDNHKSFYGKAYYIYTDNCVCLYSYGTLVYRYNINTGEVEYNMYHCYSRTTDRHIRAFIDVISTGKI